MAINKNGFSLVELSIVLVILGLLTGGILTGQSLIQAAELRAVSTEYQQYQTAMNIFKEKYFALPGDFSNAESFWTSVVTTDGNGDGFIDHANNPSEEGEIFLFWQHLVLAGLIEGNYTGISGITQRDNHDPGINCPKSKFADAAWGFDPDLTHTEGSGDRFEVEYIHVMEFGAAPDTDDADTAVLTPEELWNIDTKMDDGKPGRGKIMASHHTECGDASSKTDFDADYKLTDPSVQCSIIFQRAY